MLVVREGQVIFVRSIDAVVGASFSASPVTPAGSDGPAGVQLCRRGLHATTTYDSTEASTSLATGRRSGPSGDSAGQATRESVCGGKHLGETIWSRCEVYTSDA